MSISDSDRMSWLESVSDNLGVYQVGEPDGSLVALEWIDDNGEECSVRARTLCGAVDAAMAQVGLGRHCVCDHCGYCGSSTCTVSVPHDCRTHNGNELFACPELGGELVKCVLV